jgi:hypothetical protein
VLAREIHWDQLVEAGTVIFGPAFEAVARSGDWPARLRAAFVRRVLETHPDRAAVLGRSEAELAREFQAVSEAYGLLARLRPVPPPRERPPRRPAPAAAPPPRARAARAAVRLPRRRLHLAEFLYYSGRVGWREFAASLAWQRAQRPPVGRIAVELGFLGREDVVEILERRRREGAVREPFGEYALRRGWLTPPRLHALLGRQRQLQRPIGRYFVERGLVGEAELDEARGAVLRHNAAFPTTGRDAIRPG